MGNDDVAIMTLYMDKNKISLEERIPGSREWHFDDIPVCQEGVSHAEFWPQGNCASTQIRRHLMILSDDHSTRKSKQFAVFVIVHLVGDIHQPLHASDNDDRGGNTIKVTLPGSAAKKKNLHGAWDTDFINLAFAGKDEGTIARELTA